MSRLSLSPALGVALLLGAGPLAPLAAEDQKPAALKYKLAKGPGGSLAVFDGWQSNAVASNAWFATLSAPKGRAADFGLLVAFATPDKKVLERFFDAAGPDHVKGLLPGLKPRGKAVTEKFGGDEARVERWEGTSSPDRQERTARVIYIRKKDIAVVIIGLGTAAGVKEFGAATDIAAKSLAFTEAPVDKGLAGTWSWSTSSSVGGLTMSASKLVTITADGKFTWRNSGVGTGDSRLATFSYLKDGTMKGKVIRRGAVLTFHADDGRRWSLTYQLKGNNGVNLGGQLFAKE